MRGQFSRFLGPPRDSKFAKKLYVFSENGGPTTVVFSIFAVNAAATNFFIENSLIFNQKTIVFSVCVLQVVLYFCGHGDPHDTS